MDEPGIYDRDYTIILPRAVQMHPGMGVDVSDPVDWKRRDRPAFLREGSFQPADDALPTPGGMLTATAGMHAVESVEEETEYQAIMMSSYGGLGAGASAAGSTARSEFNSKAIVYITISSTGQLLHRQ
jgi:hypothetical protein